MNFFKKVMTFFSAIWNAILWRKTDKKAKQPAKSAKKEDQAENDSNLTLETEKVFVDVPLHSLEASELSEQGLFISDEISAAFAPIVAHNIESRTGANSEIKKYSSGVQLFGFEDETSPSLSFFSEPTRNDAETETHKDGNRESGAEENVISETYSIEPEVEVDEIRVNHVTKVFDLPVSEELPTPPSDPIATDALNCHKDHSELTLSAVESPSGNSGNFSSLTSTETPQVGAPLETQTSIENINSSFSTDHFAVFPARNPDPDLNYLAIGDEIHLFDHDGVDDTFLTKPEESGKNETVQAVETWQPTKNDPILLPETSTTLSATEAVSKGPEANKNIAASSTEVVLISVSVSSTQTIPHTNEHSTESGNKYSTNYMVKSDSLVNFLPEGGSDVDVDAVADLTDMLMETAKKSANDEEEKDIPSNYSISILKEGSLEEMMCTPRGVLKLSGDHHVDCTDGKDDVLEDPKQSLDVKTAVNDFLTDTFSFEEPLLITHHLEGSILEETSLQCDMTDNSPIFQGILETLETGLDGSESVEDLDAMTNNQYVSEPDTIGQCRSIIRDAPGLPSMPNIIRKDSRNGSSKLGYDQNEEDGKSPCRLSQFTTFHLDDEPDHVGHMKRNELLAPGMPTVKYGEIPTSSRLSGCVPSERETINSCNHTLEEDPVERFTIDSQNSGKFLDGPGWRVTTPSLQVEMHEHESTCLSFLNKHSSPILGIHENSCQDISVDQPSHTQDVGNTNDYYPFIDCSSYLFRIPEEIRKDTSFNPCVGAAPSRRSGHTNNVNLESARFDNEHGAYEHKYPNMNSMVPSCVGTAPLINACIPEEYKNTRIAKLPDGFNQRPVSQNVGTFWGAHPGLAHSGDQQQTIVGYPVSCTENYYEGEDLNVMSTSGYENDQTNVCSNSEGYGFMNPYGIVEFPIMSIPLCTQQPQSTFMPRGTLAPLVFPIGPMDVPETQNIPQNIPSVINLDATAQNEQYSIPHSWGGYPANAHLQDDEEEEREMSSIVEVRGMAPIENLSCTGTNEDDDLDHNLIPDPYFQLAENNSLHTVKSKADSYSGSLFCESLRSLISHNTENENIFPSFSCSSVQGCCPSIVLQSCETTLSNDSLPSLIVEETNYSKSVDEDYLATEKFMNDVNTALNESVLDQIQGQGDLHSNLLGRGDGSMPMDPCQSGHVDNIETPENDVMLGNSLGENISINNSKLTLLDGVLGTENGGSQPEPMPNLTWDLDGESINSAHGYFREVLDSLVEHVLTTVVDQSTPEQHIEIAGTNTDCRENLDEPHNQTNPDRDLVVQNMMFIEGMPDELRELWPKCYRYKLEKHEKIEKVVTLDAVVGAQDVPELNHEELLKDSGYTINIDNAQAFVADENPNKKSRRNRRRRKKLSDGESGVEPERCTELTGIAIGDGVRTPQDQFMEVNREKVNEAPQCSSEPRQIGSKAETSNPRADGELFANNTATESSKCEHDLPQVEDEGDGHQDETEEPDESAGNSSNNRRRRNRRRKRKN